MVIDFAAHRNMLLKEKLMCPNCKNTKAHEYLSFPLCTHPLSPYFGEVVTDKNFCPQFERMENL